MWAGYSRLDDLQMAIDCELALVDSRKAESTYINEAKHAMAFKSLPFNPFQ